MTDDGRVSLCHTDFVNLVACQLIMHNIAAPRRPSFLPALSLRLPLSLSFPVSVCPFRLPLNQPNIVALSQTAPLDSVTGNWQWGKGGFTGAPLAVSPHRRRRRRRRRRRQPKNAALNSSDS